MRVHQILAAAAVLLAMAGVSMAGPVITNGLIAYYGFEEYTTGGATVADGSGNGYTGTVVMEDSLLYPMQSVTGFNGYGKGAYFDNQNRDSGLTPYNYISLPNSNICTDGRSPGGYFTIAGWFNVDDYGTLTKTNDVFSAQSALHSGGGNSVTLSEIRPTKDYRMVLRADDYYNPNPPNELITPSVGSATSDVVPPLGSWHHLAMTYDKDDSVLFEGTTYYGVFKIYEDGVLVGTDVAGADSLGNYNYLISQWDKSALIGALGSDSEGVTLYQRGYTGTMDEVYLFNRTLSSGEVSTLSNVPEPSAIALVIAAGLSALAYRWRKH